MKWLLNLISSIFKQANEKQPVPRSRAVELFKEGIIMSDLEKLQEFLDENGVEYFTAKELCRLRKAGTYVVPPEDWWPRMLPTLKLAMMMRKELGHPLVIGNGYRPKDYNKAVGGARNSQHIHFRALDIDLPKSHKTREHQERLYELACELYLEHGDELKIGLGLYRYWRGTRVHIDTGYKKRYWSRKYVKPMLDSMK